MVLHDWECAKHGVFEGSHPICPALGCSSEKVSKIFLQAPGFKSEKTKFADASLKDIAQRYGMTNMSNKDGKAVKEGNPGAAIWGKEGYKGFDRMVAEGQQHKQESGMRTASKWTGMDKRPLPPAEVVVPRDDAAMRAKVAA
jgi:hypothetical protein